MKIHKGYPQSILTGLYIFDGELSAKKAAFIKNPMKQVHMLGGLMDIQIVQSGDPVIKQALNINQFNGRWLHVHLSLYTG